MELIALLSRMCHYAQEHIDDAEAWSTDRNDREQLLQCTSYTVACFLAQNTMQGGAGVDWDVIITELVDHPMKTEKEWKKILTKHVAELGGLKKSAGGSK